ncbi:MAG: GatB/YqeY domain-containing protein [Gammaproteobacteria bacterium]
MSIKATVNDAMKDAMRARDKVRLGTIRLIQSEFKRVEVDERIEIEDDRALTIMDKMLKQRRDSARQYEDAGRQELADIELAEIEVIQEFLPKQLSEEEIGELIGKAIADTGASGMQDMGKLMGVLKPQLQGRADMGKVSGLIKARLS